MSDFIEQYLHEISLTVDNDEAVHGRLVERVCCALYEQCGYQGMTPDDYDDVVRSERTHEFDQVVGMAVEDTLRDEIDEGATGFAHALLREFIQGLTRHLGQDWMPEADDYRAWYEGDN